MKNTRTFILSLLATTSIAAAPFAAAQAAPAKAAARTDVYHVFLVKSALGKVAQLGEYLKTPDPKAPMPGHTLLLRHQTGDSWDYALVEHMGTKATVEAAGNPMLPSARDLIAWHGDTFVAGPSWAEFTASMGMGESSKSAGAVYVVSSYQVAPGHRADLEKMLSESSRGADAAGDVLLQHLEGAPWTFLEIARYNSYADFGKSETKRIADMQKGQGGWYQLRDFSPSHTDTITDRVQ